MSDGLEVTGRMTPYRKFLEHAARFQEKSSQIILSNLQVGATNV